MSTKQKLLTISITFVMILTLESVIRTFNKSNLAISIAMSKQIKAKKLNRASTISKLTITKE